MLTRKCLPKAEINTCASRIALIGAMTRAKMCTEEKQPAVFQIEDDVLNISIRDKLADYQEQVPLQGNRMQIHTVGIRFKTGPGNIESLHL